MKSIEELQADVKKLYQELEERKKMEQESVPQTVDFHALSSKAQRYAIEGHPMSGCDEHTQQMYLMVLLSVAAMDDNVYADSFCTIYRIAHGMRFQGDIQELFLSAQQMNFSKLDECTRLFQNDDKRLLLVLECLLVTGSFDAGRKRAMEYIAELCILMKLTKDEMQFLSGLARVVLTQDISQYNCEINNTYGELFECYLKMVEDQFVVKVISRELISIDQIKIDFKNHELIVHGIRDRNKSSYLLGGKIGGVKIGTFDENRMIIKCDKQMSVKCVKIDVLKTYMQKMKGSYDSLANIFTQINTPIRCPLAVQWNSPLAYDRAQKELSNSLEV